METQSIVNHQAQCSPGFRANANCTVCEDPETMEYTNCGSCTQTCQNLVDDKFTPCLDLPVCMNKCKCKDDTPFYLESEGIKLIYIYIHIVIIFVLMEKWIIYIKYTGRCVTEAECREKLQPEPETPCPEHCIDYFNCVETCLCPGGDTGLFVCVPAAPCSDLSDSEQITTCKECEDTETMEYTTCGSCDATCDNPFPVCDDTELCIEKCQC